MPAIEAISALHDDMKALRRDLHAHPELGFQETRTAKLVAERLDALGMQVHRGIGRTGVVGVLATGSSERTIGLRADMDALPIQEENDFSHRSTHDGRMHACGHDGHTAMLLGAARYLSETRAFDGRVCFIFQPAEEGLGGAKAMIEDGLFERFPCSSIFGMHNRPGLPVGQFAVRAGPMMAGGAFFDIAIEGKGVHAARPDAGVDPVLVASHLVCALQSIVARNIHPLQGAVLSVTKVEAGDAYNVIPHRARLGGTVRAFSNKVMIKVQRNLERCATRVAEGFGARADVDFRVMFEPTVNDRDQAEEAASVCVDLVGADNVERDPPLIMASEDFSFMLAQVPGCYINIGNGGGPGSCEVHNPGYDFNDDALSLGASFFARIVERKLAKTS